MPTLGFHVPDNSDLLKKITAKAKIEHDGKTSQYVRQVVERDIANTLSVASDTPLAELARVFDSTRQFYFSDEASHLDQGLVIMRFLEALIEAMKRKEFDPEQPFDLYNSADQMAALLAAKPGGPELLRQLRDFVFSQPLAVAEGQSPYTPPETKVKNKIKTGQVAPTRAENK